MLRPLITCTCMHEDTEHRKNGSCVGKDSYGLGCECPGLEPDAFSSGSDTSEDRDDLHWGPQIGGHKALGGG